MLSLNLRKEDLNVAKFKITVSLLIQIEHFDTWNAFLCHHWLLELHSGGPPVIGRRTVPVTFEVVLNFMSRILQKNWQRKHRWLGHVLRN